MLSNNLVAADASKSEHGNFFNLIGVAVAFENYHKFRDEYFEIVESFVEKYNLNFNHNVLKTADLAKNIPTYTLKEAKKELVEQILRSEHISTIYITETYIKKSISLFDDEIKGVVFVRNHLSQYYPIIPLWRYYYNYPTRKNGHTVVDNIQGKITKAWKYVGMSSSKLSVIPHGDQTHPCLSAADLIGGYISSEIFPSYKTNIYETLKDITSAYVKTEFIGDTFKDHLVPDYRYGLNVETLFPHPIILIKSNQLNNKNIQETELFKLLLMYAEKQGGCVIFEDMDNHHRILKDGDLIVCTDDDAFSEISKIKALDRRRGYDVLDLDMAYELLEGSKNGTSL